MLILSHANSKQERRYMAMNSFKKMIMMANQRYILPKGYKELKYLQSTLNDEGYAHNIIYLNYNAGMVELTIDFQGNPNQKNNHTMPCGDYQDFKGSGFVAYKDYGYALSTSEEDRFEIPIDQRIQAKCRWYYKDIDGTNIGFFSAEINGVIKEVRRSNTINNRFLGVKLFSSYTSTEELYKKYAFDGRIYGASLYNVIYNKKVSEYIPALRIEDNTAGLYDVISKTFVTDATGKPFEYEFA
jgi:hypothetical protein